MAQTETPARRESGLTNRVVEHMLIEDGDTSECVLLPSTGEYSALATEWVSADDGSYVPLNEMQ